MVTTNSKIIPNITTSSRNSSVLDSRRLRRSDSIRLDSVSLDFGRSRWCVRGARRYYCCYYCCCYYHVLSNVPSSDAFTIVVVCGVQFDAAAAAAVTAAFGSLIVIIRFYSVGVGFGAFEAYDDVLSCAVFCWIHNDTSRRKYVRRISNSSSI